MSRADIFVHGGPEKCKDCGRVDVCLDHPLESGENCEEGVFQNDLKCWRPKSCLLVWDEAEA